MRVCWPRQNRALLRQSQTSTAGQGLLAVCQHEQYIIQASPCHGPLHTEPSLNHHPLRNLIPQTIHSILAPWPTVHHTRHHRSSIRIPSLRHAPPAVCTATSVNPLRARSSSSRATPEWPYPWFRQMSCPSTYVSRASHGSYAWRRQWACSMSVPPTGLVRRTSSSLRSMPMAGARLRSEG